MGSFSGGQRGKSTMADVETKTWADIGFRIELTGDGSPSLRLLQSLREDRPDGEAMHHSGGAAAETDLIYGSCVREVLKNIENPSFLIVGLGLGYIEMLIAKECLLYGKNASVILSFESLSELREFFFRWTHNLDLPAEIQDVYDQSLGFILQGCDLKKTAIQTYLQKYFPRVESMAAGLDESTKFTGVFEAILYDAFSSKTSPELWEEDFLKNFLKKAAAPKAWLSTYACKGNLKRALKAENFEVIQKPGFQGKRNSLFAIR
jgi:hypothetical protein